MEKISAIFHSELQNQDAKTSEEVFILTLKQDWILTII